MEERRKHPRYRIGVSARVASAAEQRLPVSTAVDISMGGVLLAFEEPLGFTTRDRLVISLELDGGQFHAIGNVTRVERGTDFRTYLAIEFSDVRAEDFDEVLAYVERTSTSAVDRPKPADVGPTDGDLRSLHTD